jgi:hypothetical protein
MYWLPYFSYYCLIGSESPKRSIPKNLGLFLRHTHGASTRPILTNIWTRGAVELIQKFPCVVASLMAFKFDFNLFIQINTERLALFPRYGEFLL